jgi:hypothetical protein
MSLPELEVLLDLLGLDQATYDENQRIQRMAGIIAHRVEQATARPWLAHNPPRFRYAL